MDEIKTGVFEISAAYNDFWQDWQVELAKEDLKRRAKAAMDKIMREGVPYVTCLYPAEKRGDKLVLTGFCVLAQSKDCEVGEAVFTDIYIENSWMHDDHTKGFAWAMHPPQKKDICIYRRIE